MLTHCNALPPQLSEVHIVPVVSYITYTHSGPLRRLCFREQLANILIHRLRGRCREVSLDDLAAAK